MTPWLFLDMALALAIERVVYAVIWHRPDLFARVCRRISTALDPVDLLSGLFVGFKGIQAIVFAAWCVVHGGFATRTSDEVAVVSVGAALALAGQVLNLSVFARLGRTGVFYGNRLGEPVPWCEGFPFSWVRHPQYVGTVLTIWGVSVLVRYPAPDWPVLPLLETVYYTLGSLVEQAPGGAPITLEESASATASDPRASTPLP